MAYTREKIPVLHKRAKGNIGENIACSFIISKGYKVITRNYEKAWGELDIIAEKDGLLHFFEVKSVTHHGSQDGSYGHKPEENVHNLKLRHIGRMIETYLSESGRGLASPFQFHVLSVYMEMVQRRASVRMIENIIISA